MRKFRSEIVPSPYLAANLERADAPQKLGLTADEVAALTLFLESLDGGPVDEKVPIGNRAVAVPGGQSRARRCTAEARTDCRRSRRLDVVPRIARRRPGG